MIKMFRNIRQRLIKNNRFSKYLLYALGEIILVVIGILIALQINTWNEEKKNRQLERKYLENFLVDMQQDSSFINGFWKNRYPQKLEGLHLAREYAKYPIQVNDSASFLNKIGMGGVLSRSSLFENKTTYRDIISTGNLSLIKKEDIRNQIVFYYTILDNTIVYMNNLRTEYATFVNSINPYDPTGNFKPDSKDYERAFQMMKSDAFLGMANNELTYAYSLKSRLGIVNRILTTALSSIQSELKINP